jgi:hypothetical protein
MGRGANNRQSYAPPRQALPDKIAKVEARPAIPQITGAGHPNPSFLWQWAHLFHSCMHLDAALLQHPTAGCSLA